MLMRSSALFLPASLAFCSLFLGRKFNMCSVAAILILIITSSQELGKKTFTLFSDAECTVTRRSAEAIQKLHWQAEGSKQHVYCDI